jgi:hypothetical protein
MQLAPVPGDLTFQTLHHLVEGGLDVAALADGPVGPARGRTGDLHPPATVDSLAGMLDDLDFHPDGFGRQARDLAQFLLGRSPDLVGDPGATSLEDEIHCFRYIPSEGTWRKRCSGPADLVFGPTLACGGVHGPRGRLAPSPSRADPAGAGLTSKPHHARRPIVALRGSFRLRLASTTGELPRATTVPGRSVTEYSNGPEGARRATGQRSRPPPSESRRRPGPRRTPPRWSRW